MGSPEMSILSKSLHRAVRAGSVPLVKLLLWSGASVNASGLYQQTALHLACESNHINMESVINILLTSGAEVNLQDCNEITPLHQACVNKQPNLLRTIVMLLKAGAEVNVRDWSGRTPLHFACMSGDLNLQRVVDLLLTSMAEVNVQDCSGRTPLHEACCFMNLSVAHTLMEHGAKVGLMDSEGMTPLHEICNLWGNEKEGIAFSAELLATNTVKLTEDSKNVAHSNKGEDIPFVINLKTVEGITALHYASKHNYSVHLVSLLLSLGADLRVKDKNGKTALHWAIEAHAENVLHVLAKHEADMNNRACVLDSTPSNLVTKKKQAENVFSKKIMT